MFVDDEREFAPMGRVVAARVIVRKSDSVLMSSFGGAGFWSWVEKGRW